MSTRNTILVVDDEENVRQVMVALVANILPEYEVIGIGDMAAAITNIKEAPVPHRMVITDFGLKEGRGGEEIVTEAKIRHPETKVLVVSGFLTTARRSHVVDKCPAADAFLEKPYDVRELKAIIRLLLDTAHGTDASDHSVADPVGMPAVA